MGLPRPIRLLAAATMVLFLFLVLQIMRSPTTVKLPGSTAHKYDDMIRDPNLDGMAHRDRVAQHTQMLTHCHRDP